MLFSKLKPEMFLIPPPNIGSKAWTLIKRKQGDTVIIDDYWVGASGRLHRTYNRVIQNNTWDGSLRRSYGLAAAKDAQDLIVAIFKKALGLLREGLIK